MIRKNSAWLLVLAAAGLLAMLGSSNAIAKTKTGTKDFCLDVSSVIPAAGVASVPLPTGKLPKKAKVTDVDARVRLTDSGPEGTNALTLFLTSPKGGLSNLANARPVILDPNADNFGIGTGCASAFTTFDDEAATPISAGNSPFAASFKPETPLSVMDGSLAAGLWSLYAINCSFCQNDVGSIHAVGLKIDYRYPVKKKKK